MRQCAVFCALHLPHGLKSFGKKRVVPARYGYFKKKARTMPFDIVRASDISSLFRKRRRPDPYAPPKRNATPTAAEMAMKTMGCHFFVGFTQLVNASKIPAKANPRQ